MYQSLQQVYIPHFEHVAHKDKVLLEEDPEVLGFIYLTCE